MKPLYCQDGIVIFMLPPDRVKIGGTYGLKLFRNGDYSFMIDCKANGFAKKIIIKLFEKKLGYKVAVQESLYHTNFILTDKKQKFEFILKYGGLPKA